MEVIWYGTACFAVRTGTAGILIDPFVPWKGAKAPVVISDFDGYSRILATHGHFDHIESIPEIIKRNPDAYVYCTKTPCRTLMSRGVQKKNLRRISPGRRFRIGDITVQVHASRHADLQVDLKERMTDVRTYRYICNLPHALYTNMRHPENRETVMYELQAEGKRLQVLGSMNLLPGEEYPKGADVLFLPYVGYRDNYVQADRILRKLQPESVILSHFDDTFPPLTRSEDTGRIEQGWHGVPVIRPEYKKPLIL